jgi:alkanesulfonate monooxygenase SsuD/methylene tetrahydromethanopterin reductase-like flavin-dependent oxidoreductase (luciferase family)
MVAVMHPLRGPDRFKLGVFSTNADGGLALTTVPERWKATWADNVVAARIADEGGFDFFLPIARWAGFGGKTKAREWSFETFTWAAGLAALTRRMAIFSTVHVPLVHPIYAAKALATVDHISSGRAGLNIVCGWNPTEFAMFGTVPDERAYDRAAEWIDIVERAYVADEPFDFDGAYYKLKGVVSRPASLQKPRPVTMNAAFGAPGRDFAARHCDFLFSTFTDIEDGRRHLADIRARAKAAARDVGAYTVCHVVCRASQAEAEDAYDRYAVREADQEAVDNHMAGKKQFSQSHDERAYREYRQRFAGGAGTFPLVGTPDRIATMLGEIAAEGWSGAALSFLNYTDELPFFIEEVFPLLREAGLKT